MTKFYSYEDWVSRGCTAAVRLVVRSGAQLRT